MKKLLIILFFLSCLATCRAQNRYVSTTGNDTNTGLEDAPFATIVKALTTIGVKDTIFIYAGTYPECADYFSFGLAGRQVILRKFQSTISIVIKGTDFHLQTGDPKTNTGAMVGLSTELISDPIMASQICVITTYYNTKVTVWAIKNNCPVGKIGQRIYYYVDANKYSSTISQADAQAKAVAEATKNKQANANLKGTCR